MSCNLYEADISWSNAIECNLGRTKLEDLEDPTVFFFGNCRKTGTNEGVVFEQTVSATHRQQANAPPKKQPRRNPTFTILKNSGFSAGPTFALPQYSSDYWRVADTADPSKEYDAVHVFHSVHKHGVLYVLETAVADSEKPQDLEILEEAPVTVTKDKQIKVCKTWVGSPMSVLAETELTLKAVATADKRMMSHSQSTTFKVCQEPEVEWCASEKSDFGITLSIKPADETEVYFYPPERARDGGEDGSTEVPRFTPDSDWTRCLVGEDWEEGKSGLTKELEIVQDCQMNFFACRPGFLPRYIAPRATFEMCDKPSVSLVRVYANGTRIMDARAQPHSVDSIVDAGTVLTADVEFVFGSGADHDTPAAAVRWYTPEAGDPEAANDDTANIKFAEPHVPGQHSEARRLRLTFPPAGPSKDSVQTDVDGLHIRTFSPNHVPTTGAKMLAISAAPTIVQDLAACKAGRISFCVTADDDGPLGGGLDDSDSTILYTVRGIGSSSPGISAFIKPGAECAIEPRSAEPGRLVIKAVAWTPGKMLSKITEAEFEVASKPSITLTKWTGRVQVTAPDDVDVVCAWGETTPAYPVGDNSNCFKYSGTLTPPLGEQMRFHAQVFKDNTLPSMLQSCSIRVEKCPMPSISIDWEGLLQIEHDEHCRVIYSTTEGDLGDPDSVPASPPSDGAANTARRYTSPVAAPRGKSATTVHAMAYRCSTSDGSSEHVGHVPSDVATASLSLPKCATPEIDVDLETGQLTLKPFNQEKGYVVFYTIDGKTDPTPSRFDADGQAGNVFKYCPDTDGSPHNIDMLAIQDCVRARAYKIGHFPSGLLPVCCLCVLCL